jgi:hypothetical protein
MGVGVLFTGLFSLNNGEINEYDFNYRGVLTKSNDCFIILAMMRPNLRAHDIESIVLTASLAYDDELYNQLTKASRPSKNGRVYFFDSYKIDADSHRAWVVVAKEGKSDKKLGVEINYEVARGGRLKKGLPRIENFLGVFPVFEDLLDFDCQVNFRFGMGRKVKPIIALPLRLIDSADAPFNEIDMIHMVKYDNKRTAYDVLLGLVERKNLLETIYFDYRSKMCDRLMDEVIEKAVSISKRFVVKKE